MGDLILRVNTLQGCARIDFDTGGSISASVGVGGRNVPEDVRTVQVLLNSIPPAKGGPDPLLDVDGLVGPKTITAIRKFQQSQLGFNDGRVDPGAKTISKLDELQASAGSLKSSIAAVPGPIPIPPGLVRGVKRLATATAVIGDIG